MPGFEPKSTLVEPETNPVPVTVTVLVPAWGPLLGLTAVTVGGGVVGVGVGRAGSKSPPPVVETLTETVPVPDGTTTVSEVEPLTLTEVPALVPNSTLVEPETNPVPVSVTGVGPGLGPVVRADGGDRRRGVVGVLVTRRVDAEVPLGVVTVTSTVPVPDGALTVRLVELSTSMEVPGFEVPKSTAVAR